MKPFADLFNAIDSSNKTLDKVAALRDYFLSQPPQDVAWAIYFLIGRKPRSLIKVRKLSEWAAQIARVPAWLFEECYHAVGDLAETISLLLPGEGNPHETSLAVWVEEKLLPLQNMDDEKKEKSIKQAWSYLGREERFVWNKLLTGAFRVGVSQKLVARALAEGYKIDEAVISHRLMGQWTPGPEFVRMLSAHEQVSEDISKPYPFFLAYPVETPPPGNLGSRNDWQIEWKWDGIRAQIIKRKGQIFIWTRGEELVTDRYPDIVKQITVLPDGIVLDGELLPWKNGALSFAELQKRIGRKTLSAKLLSEVPVSFMAYDVLELDGKDVRNQSMDNRRALLDKVISSSNQDRLKISPIVEAKEWSDVVNLHVESRARNVEGFMLKRRNAAYGTGRTKGDWWKWKIAPYTIDAVLVYAQRGSGKRASLYTDYTFAVWNDDKELVPFAKAYSGLTDAEIKQVDQFIRRNTQEQFGPVRTVKPELVFELAFEGIQRSNRHKSGVAVRFPRIARWRTDKVPVDADKLSDVIAMLPDSKNSI